MLKRYLDQKLITADDVAETFDKYGVAMGEFREAVPVTFPEGIHAREFMAAREVCEADAIISVSKMKTHALEHITGAVKNQYGCVQGFHKARGHTLYPSPESFARMPASMCESSTGVMRLAVSRPSVSKRGKLLPPMVLWMNRLPWSSQKT